MASLNYVQPKSSRNRFSLFLQLSAKKDSSQPGISSESYFASTPTTTTVDFMESCNPTSSILAGPKTLFRVNSGSSSPHLPRSPLRMDTSFFEEHIPPTTNELDAKEKARLLKKTRKLSKVFGEDIQRTTSRSLGKTPSHRRSISTHASDPEPSSRQQTTRKFSSQSDLASSSESGSRMEVSDWEAIPPVPSLPRESIDAFSGQGPAQHRIQPALYNLTHPKQSSDDVRALIPILSSSSRVSTDDIQKRRLTKPRPNIGEDKSKSASHPLKTRKSYDSLATTAVSPLDGTVLNKSLHRSRSLSTNRKKKLDEIDAAVEFDPQKFGRKQVSEGVHGVMGALPPTIIPPDNVQIEQIDSVYPAIINDAQTRRASMLSVVSSLRDCGTPSNLDGDAPTASSSISIHSVNSVYPDSNIDENFRERRRRAAKLAQFFGVEYHDIDASIPVTGHVLEPPHDITPSGKWEPVRVEPSVGIRTNTRRFWGGRGNLKEAQVGDVIPKLRELRAS